MRPDDDLLARLSTDPQLQQSFGQFQESITSKEQAIRDQANKDMRRLGFTIETSDKHNKCYKHTVGPDGTELYDFREIYTGDTYEFYREIIEESNALGTITQVKLTQTARAGENKQLHPSIEIIHSQVTLKQDIADPHRSTWIQFGVPYEWPLFASHFDTQGEPTCLVLWGGITEDFVPGSEALYQHERHLRSRARTAEELLDIKDQLLQAKEAANASRAVLYWRIYPIKDSLFYYAHTNPEIGPIGPIAESDLQATYNKGDFGEDLFTDNNGTIFRVRIEKNEVNGGWLVVRSGVVKGDMIFPQLFISMQDQLDQVAILDHVTPKQGLLWTKTNAYLPFNGYLAPLETELDTEEIDDEVT